MKNTAKIDYLKKACFLFAFHAVPVHVVIQSIWLGIALDQVVSILPALELLPLYC